MTYYKNMNSGDVFTLEELEKDYNMFADEIQQSAGDTNFADYLDRITKNGEVLEVVKMEVDFIDGKTGARSAIDTIYEHTDYTAADYISDCEKNSDSEYTEMLQSGNIVLVPVID